MNKAFIETCYAPTEYWEYGYKRIIPFNLAWALLKPIYPPEEVIGQILRRGHKMIITAPSKSGKTWLMIDLALAVASGKDWLGFHIKQGKVLYLNVEMSPSTFLIRCKDVANKRNIPLMDQTNITCWCLRGANGSFDVLVDRIVDAVKKDKYTIVIIDPIFKVLEGSENDQEAVARFCNCLDRIASEGASVVYTHHHSKGAQSGKSAMDRGSGSGVFARDADAIMDLLEVDCPEEFQENKKVRAFHVEWTLREFKDQPIMGIVFEYPTFMLDNSGKVLDAKPRTNQRRGGNTSGRKRHEEREANIDKFVKAYSEGINTVNDMKSKLGVVEKTIRNYAKETGLYVRKGIITGELV